MPRHQREDDPDLTFGCNLYINSLSFTRFLCSSIMFCWKSSFSLSAFLSASSSLLSNCWIFSIRFWIFESWYATWSSIAFISSSFFILSPLKSLLLLLLTSWWKRPLFPRRWLMVSALLDRCLFYLIKLINSGSACNWVLLSFENFSSFALILFSKNSLNVCPSSVATIQSLYL